MAITRQLRNIPWAITLIVSLVSACSSAGENNLPTSLPPLEVVTPAEFTVARDAVQRTLAFTGRVAPVVSQPVFFEDDGVVTGAPFQQGDRVSAGDVIAHLAISDLKRQLVNAELNLQIAELQTNQANLVAAEIALNRATTEDDRRLAEAQLADAQNQAQASQLSLQLLREDIARLEAEIERRQITAPFDGILQSLNVRPGDSVAAFAPIGIVVDPSRLEVTAELPPAMVASLGVGQEVTVTLRNSKATYTSVIRQLPAGFGAGSDNLARITLPETADLTPGELANVLVVLEEKLDVLTLPPAAIRNFQGRTFVIVSEGDGVRRRYDVRLGIQSETLVEIVEGVVEGQIVIGE